MVELEKCMKCGCDPVFWNATKSRPFTVQCPTCERKATHPIDFMTAVRIWNATNKVVG